MVHLIMIIKHINDENKKIAENITGEKLTPQV